MAVSAYVHTCLLEFVRACAYVRACVCVSARVGFQVTAPVAFSLIYSLGSLIRIFLDMP